MAHRSRSLALGVAVWSVLAWAQPPAAARRHASASLAPAPPVIDGVLGDAEWAAARPLEGFVQVEPTEGKPATLPTRVFVLFDATALYVAARCEDPQGTAGLQQSDLARDFDLESSDAFGITLDTLGDGRNAFGFFVNPYGAQKDLQVIDDSLVENRWDTVWKSAVSRDAHGWSVELAIPWKSLRTKEGATSFGFNAGRRAKRLGEESSWAPFPRGYSLFRMSYAGTLEGLSVPKPGLLDVQLRPYGIVRADRVGAAPVGVAPAAGGELTWKLGASTVLDVTVNTDFAETDVDRRVVNLGRFNVLLPEQRQFFLESSGVFEGGASGWLSPFFSRSIGLSANGNTVPIEAGARFVSRTDEHSVGALVVQTGEGDGEPGALFGVARYSHNFGEESRVGGLLVARHDFPGLGLAGRTNVVPTVDGLWRVGPFSVQGFISGSSSVNDDGSASKLGGAGFVGASAQGGFGFLTVNAGFVSPDYEARAGFISRPDSLATSTSWWTDYRPAWLPSWMRSLGTEAFGYAIWSGTDASFQESYLSVNPLVVKLQAGDKLLVGVDRSWQALTDVFSPVPGVNVPRGDYQYDSYQLGFFTESSRAVSGSLYGAVGQYYRADWRSVNARLALHPIPHVALAVSWQYNHFQGEGVEPGGAETHLVLAEARLAVSPRLQLIGSFQRDTAGDVTIANARLAWEFAPLSFLYVVYTDTRSALPSPTPAPPEQKLIAKLTYTWRP